MSFVTARFGVFQPLRRSGGDVSSESSLGVKLNQPLAEPAGFPSSAKLHREPFSPVCACNVLDMRFSEGVAFNASRSAPSAFSHFPLKNTCPTCCAKRTYKNPGWFHGPFQMIR